VISPLSQKPERFENCQVRSRRTGRKGIRSRRPRGRRPARSPSTRRHGRVTIARSRRALAQNRATMSVSTLAATCGRKISTALGATEDPPMTTSKEASPLADVELIEREGRREAVMVGRSDETSEEPDEPRYRHVLKLYITHPAWPAKRITEGLGEEPTYAWNVGDTARIGDRLLKGRKRHQTVWCIKEWREGNRHFSLELDEMCDRLEPKRSFLEEIRRTSGKVLVIFELAGVENIGDVLTPEQLRRTGDLGLGVGIEVFPTLN
jgi:hypothetical protein